ncbi:MAG: ABC transporter permease [Clostridia bacterium]|nr:ABC transporter permease [Clostridia bacterium]
MKNVWTIVKKEFYRFFRDKRMIITVLLPGILIYVLYSLMGTVFSEKAVDKDYKPTAYVINMPTEIEETLESALSVYDKDMTEEEAKEKVSVGEADLALVFPDNLFANDSSETPDVRIYYNSSKNSSVVAFSIVEAVLDLYKQPAFSVNAQGGGDLADEKDTAVSILSMLVPMLMFAMLASACIAVAPESIAGEKERGTMATLLVTPIKRVQLAVGKIISLTCFAMLSGVSSFIGVIFSLPKLVGGFIGAETAALYGVGDYFMLFGLIISIIFAIISAFSVLSSLAKSVKEAGAMITPLMMVIILLGLATMFVSANPSLGLFAIPLLGSGLAISSIMSFTATGAGVALAIISNVVLALLLTVLLAFTFKSEKIMFGK